MYMNNRHGVVNKSLVGIGNSHRTAQALYEGDL